MEQFWIQLLAILMLLTQTCSDTTELIGAVGGAVTFHINSTDTGGNGAFWRFGYISIVTVPFKDPSEPVFSKEYETRVAVSEGGRALSISQLRMEDAGTYSVTIDGKISTFNLRVYKELPEPTVTCKTQECSDERCLLSLRCSVPGAGFGNVSYTWIRGLWLWDEGSVVVAVDKSSWDNLGPLTCTARNAVSSSSVTVTTPEGLCPGALLDIRIGIGVTLLVVAVVAVAMVVLLVFLVFLCKSKGFWPARTGRRWSSSDEISATAGPGHQDYLPPTRWLGPEPGLARDKHGTGWRQTASEPPGITDELKPVLGLTMDHLKPVLGLTMDQLRPLPGLTRYHLKPVPGLTMDRLRPEPGLTSDQLRPELGPASDQHGPELGPASE